MKCSKPLLLLNKLRQSSPFWKFSSASVWAPSCRYCQIHNNSNKLLSTEQTRTTSREVHKKKLTNGNEEIPDIIFDIGHEFENLDNFFHNSDHFPHWKYNEDLQKISDLSQPVQWFPEARSIKRKIIFHAGPTNSGKTHNAISSFIKAKSGRYHGPLRMLAVEVFQKSNDLGTPCDLLTGESRKYAISEDSPANHMACTVEMASMSNPCDVAIIDEIQMITDSKRGWAWTKALLGVPAKELHVCGESSAIEIVKQLSVQCGDSFKLHTYERLTNLTVEDEALGSLENVQPGDCIVCFNLEDIHNTITHVQQMGHEVAIIYGDLPPGTKCAQSKKFNDSNHKCSVMVATDAIGMGLNLCIRRIVFYSLRKLYRNHEGKTKIKTISVSQALQIAGRAGRYGTQYKEGFVTTLRSKDRKLLKKILQSTPPVIKLAGIIPTSTQIEQFAVHLPNYNLTQLIDIFTSMCTIDESNFFMCYMIEIRLAAKLLEDVNLPLRTRFIFCLGPVNQFKRNSRSILLMFAKQYADNIPVDYEWMRRHLKWPFKVPLHQQELSTLEDAHEALTLYFWLSYRFENMFPDRDLLRKIETDLDSIILEGINNLIAILENEPDMKKTVNYLVKKNELKYRIVNEKKENILLQNRIYPGTFNKI